MLNSIVIELVKEIDEAIAVSDNPTVTIKLTEIKLMIFKAAEVEVSDFVIACVRTLIKGETNRHNQNFIECVNQLSVSEICAIANISEKTVYRCLKNNHFSKKSEEKLREFMGL